MAAISMKSRTCILVLLALINPYAFAAKNIMLTLSTLALL
jgi:hypothetical protein